MIFDKTGREIKPGAIIVYGHALGRCAGLRFGKVLDIKDDPSRAYWGTRTEVKITVQGVDDDRKRHPPTLCKKTGTLLYPDRIVVLEPGVVPEKIRELLEAA